MKAYLVASALLSSLVAMPASAALLNFSWASTIPSEDFTFQLDSNPTPALPGTVSPLFDVEVSTVSFGTILARLNFHTGGGLTAVPADSSIPRLTSTLGPRIYSGTAAAPVFAPGIFELEGFSSTNGDGILTIASADAAVPEPATWAMFIGGFGLIGATMRRRPSMKVRFVRLA